MVVKELVRTGYQIYNSAWFGVTSRYPLGTNVYDRDWEVLVILDTCRVDALREVAPEYEWLPTDEIESMWSIASNSRGWIASTFTEKYLDKIEDTVYVSVNGYSPEILDRGRKFPSEAGIRDVAKWNTVTGVDFFLHHPIQEYHPDFELANHHPAELVLDRGITTYEKYHPEFLILHFHQPHAPYRHKAYDEGRELHSWEEDPFTALKNGDVDFETVWNAYLDSLRYVLDNVDVLRRYLPGSSIAISADHGEAFGEYGVYRHPLGIPHPSVRRVPWVVVEGTGELEEYNAQYPIDEAERYHSEPTDEEVKERLRDLGYAE